MAGTAGRYLARHAGRYAKRQGRNIVNNVISRAKGLRDRAMNYLRARASPTRKRKFEPIHGIGTGGTFSRHKRGGRKPKNARLSRLLSPKQILQQIDVGQLTCPIGGQGYYGWHFGTISDCQHILADNALVDYGSTLPTGLTSTVMKTNVYSMSQIISMQSMDTSNLYLTIYDVGYRHDSVYDGATIWNSGMTDNDDGSASAGTATPWVTPFQSSRFTTFCKVLKVTKVELASGRSHEHVFSVGNRNLNAEYINNTSATFLKGLTYTTVVVVRGSPTNDATNKTVVSLTAGKIDMVRRLKFTFGRVLTTQPRVFLAANNLGSVTTAEVQNQEGLASGGGAQNEL